MPYSHHKLQVLRGKYSSMGTVKESRSSKVGRQRLTAGPRNHDVNNNPEEFDFDSEQATYAYWRRYLKRKGRSLWDKQNAVEINTGP